MKFESFWTRDERVCMTCQGIIPRGGVYLRHRKNKDQEDWCPSCAEANGLGHLLRPPVPPRAAPGVCSDCGKTTEPHKRVKGRCNPCYRTTLRRERGIAERRLLPETCQYADCNEPHFAKDRCRRCYQRDRRRERAANRTVKDMPPIAPGETRRFVIAEPEHVFTGHWNVQPDVTVIHWPVKGHPFPYTCPDCGVEIKEATG